ncbi:hypothetical protein RA276_31190, partial [Pseudomonas syringae pv. tagetis]
AIQRTLRLADGADEVHRAAVGKFELGMFVRTDVVRSRTLTAGRSLHPDLDAAVLDPPVVDIIGGYWHFVTHAYDVAERYA